jgi:hypothetical protein
MCADFVAAIWGAMPDDASDADLGAALCLLIAHFFETLRQARGEVIAEQHRQVFIETLQEINLSTSLQCGPAGHANSLVTTKTTKIKHERASAFLALAR